MPALNVDKLRLALKLPASFQKKGKIKGESGSFGKIWVVMPLPSMCVPLKGVVIFCTCELLCISSISQKMMKVMQIPTYRELA